MAYKKDKKIVTVDALMVSVDGIPLTPDTPVYIKDLGSDKPYGGKLNSGIIEVEKIEVINRDSETITYRVSFNDHDPEKE